MRGRATTQNLRFSKAVHRAPCGTDREKSSASLRPARRAFYFRPLLLKMVASRAIGSLSRFSAFRILRSRGEPGWGLGRVPECLPEPRRRSPAFASHCLLPTPSPGPRETGVTVQGPHFLCLWEGIVTSSRPIAAVSGSP